MIPTKTSLVTLCFVLAVLWGRATYSAAMLQLHPPHGGHPIKVYVADTISQDVNDMAERMEAMRLPALKDRKND